MEYDGRLEHWWYDGLNHVIWGHVYEDRKNRFYDNCYIHTSILSMPKNPELSQGMVVKTRNSTYLLGTKSTDFQN